MNSTNTQEESENLWDKYSSHVDDNLDSFANVAGQSLINRTDFMKAISELTASQNPTPPLQEDVEGAAKAYACEKHNDRFFTDITKEPTKFFAADFKAGVEWKSKRPKEEKVQDHPIVREVRVNNLLGKMMECDMQLYERILDTTGFANYFNQLVKLAKIDQPVPKKEEEYKLTDNDWRELQNQMNIDTLEMTKDENSLKQIKVILDNLTEDERMDVMGNYCKNCGSKDTGCNCWNDD